MPHIIPIAVEHVVGFHETLGLLAQERTWLVYTDTPSIEWAMRFVLNNIRNGYAQFVAVEKNRVIGWCGIIPNAGLGFRHSGSVGMGVIKEWRHQGLGKALLNACLRKSFENGLTRIELEIDADNAIAIGLHRKFGFKKEGVKRHAYCLDGQHKDLLIMALCYGEWTQSRLQEGNSRIAIKDYYIRLAAAVS
jgi:RimJ/RimL family protein N-acetyltransferase